MRKVIVVGLVLGSLTLVALLLGYLLFIGKIRFNYPSKKEFPILGIDISNHQGKITWTELRKENISFVIIKATEGGDYKDPLFLDRVLIVDADTSLPQTASVRGNTVKLPNVPAKTMLGINNRNLKTFEVSLDTTLGMLAEVPKDKLLVTESGIASAQDVQKMRAAGVHAFLVGEAFMRADEPGLALAQLFA